MMGVMDDMTAADVPTGQVGQLRVERFEVDRNSQGMAYMAAHGMHLPPGVYTRLMEGGRTDDAGIPVPGSGKLWMSDTPDEKRDHMFAAYEMRERGGRVLIAGLGLGMVLRVALLSPDVDHVDVVEVNPDVIALVGPTYRAIAAAHDVALVIHQADIFTLRWPAGTRWDTAWFDVWADVSTDDLAEMSRLRRSYGRRTGWNDCWARHKLLRYRAQYRRGMAGWFG